VARGVAGAARILIAEDNPANQKVALYHLKRLGYDADVAADGLEVLARLDQRRYDLVFMDCQMPNLDGFDATRRIRGRSGADRSIPIIALTASTNPSDRARCLHVGMNDYLPKPIQRDDLATTLSRWLARGGPGEASG